MKAFRPVFLTLAICGLLLLAACGTASSGTTGGGGSSGGSTPGSNSGGGGQFAAVSDVCALATAQEIAGLVGGTQTFTPAPDSSEILPACKYTASNGDEVITEVQIDTSAQVAQANFASTKSAAVTVAGSQVQTVTGLGDAAFFDGINAVDVLKSNAELGANLTIAAGNVAAATIAADKRIDLLLLSRLK